MAKIHITVHFRNYKVKYLKTVLEVFSLSYTVEGYTRNKKLIGAQTEIQVFVKKGFYIQADNPQSRLKVTSVHLDSKSVLGKNNVKLIILCYFLDQSWK